MNWLLTKQELKKQSQITPLTQEQKETVEQYIPAVYKFTYKFSKLYDENKITNEELISYGFTTLIQCVIHFKPELNVKFITYLYSSLKRNYKGMYNSLIKDCNRLSFYSDWEENVKDYHLQETVINYDTVKENNYIFYKLAKKAKLNKNELHVVWYRNNGLKLRELAVELGVSRERVRQIELKAMYKLREAASRMKDVY